MNRNVLEKLFDSFNRSRIIYCVRSRYRHLPKTLTSSSGKHGDVDLFIEKKDFPSALHIIKKSGFILYPYTEPNFFYYFYDKDLGLINLDILLLENMIPIRKFKNFYISRKIEKNPVKVHRNEKTLFQRLSTGLRRRIHYLGKGKLIVFDGPDGSGKTTLSRETLNALERFKIKKRYVHFGAQKLGENKFLRIFQLSYHILKTYTNIFLGRIIITDRYIYLTFRKNSILKNLIRAIAPKPDIVFIAKASPDEIRKRKKGQKDCLSREKISELYSVLSEVRNTREINSEKPIKKNLPIIVNAILELYE